MGYAVAFRSPLYCIAVCVICIYFSSVDFDIRIGKDAVWLVIWVLLQLSLFRCRVSTPPMPSPDQQYGLAVTYPSLAPTYLVAAVVTPEPITTQPRTMTPQVHGPGSQEPIPANYCEQPKICGQFHVGDNSMRSGDSGVLRLWWCGTMQLVLHQRVCGTAEC